MTISLLQLLSDYKIIIPIMQRDYAQGRKSAKVTSIRKRFLNQIRVAITEGNKPLELDFVYGHTKEIQVNAEATEKNFVPLDGQQRLTTLFLFHWFIAVQEGQLEQAKDRLSKFTYETRYSSRLFCNKLVNFKPEELNTPISQTIINEPWFFTAWKSDLTISSMLTMLDSIQIEFREVENVWPLLSQDQSRIVFHLLPMEKLGLPDDLYIKMNSRGKELTEFEHFKSQFSELITEDQALIFNIKIDQAWSDLFWNLYKDSSIPDIAKHVDNAFLRFFNYISDVIVAKDSIDLGVDIEDFAKYRKIYGSLENTKFLFSCLDNLSTLNLDKPYFFESVFYINETNYEKEKTRLFFQNASADLFKKCASNYDATARVNPFSIGEQLLLYACIIHLNNNTQDFSNRIRVLRNLIANSEDTVRKEFMPSLLNAVSEIILNNNVDEDAKFSKSQIKEEEIKRDFIHNNLDLKDVLCKLEDHRLLQGCIALFKLDEELPIFAAHFHKIFSTGCKYENISRALLTFGDYSQKYDWRRRVGNHNESVWRELFTPSQRRDDFQKTQEVLYALFEHLTENPEITLESIINDYLSSFSTELNKPKNWSYYFVKYPEFRKNEDGFYTWWPKHDGRYECLMMRRSTTGGFHWSPFLLTIKSRCKKQLNLDNYNAPLIYIQNNAALKITNLNNGFKLTIVDEESAPLLELLRIAEIINSENIYNIPQSEDGLDLIDRIELGVELISKIDEIYI